ncbi:hypothetical protein [Burkholderia ubonensis]|uniref:Uncharacterized protein n=1 Tax=Burkholderia ubonensis subsp. mesacidophila TaxID=265293 RepID=A0A2A4EWI4_9BURK|nr:hypothetical protein [Burkholderia ubonensis]PCE24792.1 hypothetical protein BZL54_32485 [Burkholderia ubonensis subsp. mesacidophila]
MNHVQPARSAHASDGPAPAAVPRAEVRRAVKDLLLQSQAFQRLPGHVQQQIAHDTAQIADYLAAPEGIPGHTLANSRVSAQALDNPPGAEQYQTDRLAVQAIGAQKFKAGAAREGAEVAGLFLQKVNFPTFVAKLIQGVFHAIVQSSIEQMEAYGKLVASVAQSLDNFRDDNVTQNQGRDHLVEQFPDIFQIGVTDGDDGQSQPRLQVRDDVDEDSALKRVNDKLASTGAKITSLDTEDDDNERALVEAARTHVATGRQQLLATMVLMGINRIVVTDGRISAKIMYDFQAQDSRKLRRSATAYDYARDQYGNVQKSYGSEGSYDRGASQSTGGGDGQDASQSPDQQDRDASWYTKGTYKYTETPIVTAMSAASDTQDESLKVKATLAGTVDVNFKSDYFPLEKMVDPAQIAQLQLAAVPGRGAGVRAPAGAAGAATPAAGTGAGAGAGAAATPGAGAAAPAGGAPAPAPAA